MPVSMPQARLGNEVGTAAAESNGEASDIGANLINWILSKECKISK